MNKGFTIFSVLLLFQASSALAEDPAEVFQELNRHQNVMRGADSNEDGEITKQEFVSYHAAYFKKIDTNNDGKISQEELSARQNDLMAAMQQQVEKQQKMAMEMMNSKEPAQEPETNIAEELGLDSLPDIMPAAGDPDPQAESQ